MNPPIAHHAPAESPAIDYDRVLRVIVAIENTPWHRPGGAYGFQNYAWAEETSLPVELASNPHQAAIIAKIRLCRFAAIATSRGIAWTPRLAFESWRWGIDEAIYRTVKRLPSGYALRSVNLFNDPTFL